MLARIFSPARRCSPDWRMTRRRAASIVPAMPFTVAVDIGGTFTDLGVRPARVLADRIRRRRPASAADLARELRIREILVPLMPGLMSARGILLEPLSERASSLQEGRVEAAVERLDAACEELCRRDECIGSWRVERRADIRYIDQAVAADVYGVVLGAGSAVDEQATAGRRSELASRPPGIGLGPGEVHPVGAALPLRGAG